MFEELFELTIDGAFASKDEFNEFAKEASNEEIFSIIKEGAFTDFNEFNSIYNLKKKDELQSTSPKVVMESITEDENQSFLSDFIEKNEEEAKPLLEKKLTEKGFSVQQTGIGNALLVTDNVTGEETEIDLKPIKIFGANKEEEISKVKKLIETPIDNRRKLLSTNNKSFFDRDVDSYIESLKNKFPNFSIQNFDDENIVISKGDKSQVIKIKDIKRGGISIREGLSTPDVVSSNSKAFKEINKFIYNNITDDESSSIIGNFNVDTLKNIDENLKNIESKVDVSIESAEANVYNKDYFKGLFQFLDSSNVDIPQDVRNELEKGTKLKVFTTRNGITSREIPLSREEIDSALNQYFYNDLDTKKKIEAYNLSKTVSSRKEKIDRAKKLKIEVLYDSLPNKEEVKEVIRQKNKEITEEELDIQANLKMASSDISNMVKSLDLEVKSMLKENPDVTFKTILDDKGNVVDIVSDKPSEDLEKLKKRVSSAILNYEALVKQSKYKLDKIAANKKTTEEFLEAANKNYDLFDTAMADLKNALVQMGGGAAIMKTLVEGVVEDAVGIPINLGITQPLGALPADVRTDLIRGTMNESRENLDKFYKTKRMYDESIKEGSLGEFSIRTFFEQSPNIALAIGTSGVAPSLGLGKLGTQLLIGTEFGLTSAGQKYDEITTRQEFGKIAKKGLEELESIKGAISDEEYLVQKYELERALKDSEISSKDKTLSVLGTGIVEGGITAFLGTAPNSIKILRDLKKPTKFLDDILVSNYKAASKTLKELGKRTGGEIIEETSIDVLTQVNDYMFLNDQIDLSSLDDVAVTSIITSGAMNTPSTAYSTILTQVNVNRYKNKIKGITDQVQSLKNMLMNPDLTDIQRNSIHDSINSSISQIAGQTTEMEGDAMLLGSENIKEMLTLSSVRNSMLKKAGVENDDSYDIANTKIDNYLSTLSESESKNFVDQMKFIDSKRNDILSKINYEGAIERVFGDKGNEIAKTLDKTLTPQQKYVEVYKQVRQEINDNAKKEFDAIQEQETRDIPDAKRAEGVQEMETEVREPAVEETEKVKIDDTQKEQIEKFRQQEIEEVELAIARSNETGEIPTVKGQPVNETTIEDINKKYDKELETDKETAQYLINLKSTKKSDPTTYWSVSDVEVEVADDSTIIDTEDGSTVVKPDGDIAGLFKKVTSKAKGVAQNLLKRAVEAGGRKLDNFDGYLTKQYEKAGFRVVARTPFNKEYAPFGWNQETHGTPDVVAMIYDPNNELDIEERMFDDPENGYDQMIEYRDSLLPETKITEKEAERVTPEVTEGISKLRDTFNKKGLGSKKPNTPAQKVNIEDQAIKAKQSISKLFPNVDIEVYYNENDYHKAIGEVDQSGGTYFNNKVYINLTRATDTTVAHEVFHAVLSQSLKSDTEIQNLTKKFIDSLINGNDKDVIQALVDKVDTIEQYKDVANEEVMAELFGVLAGFGKKLKPKTRSLVKRFLDRVAKILGLKKFTDNELIDVLNTLSKKVALGESIEAGDIGIFKGGKVVDNPSQAISKKSVGLFDVQYTEDNRRNELIDKKLLVEINDVSGFSGLQATITSPDDMLAGTISIDGEQIFEGGGGIFFVTKYGDVWASGKKGTANTLAKMINDSLKNNGDRGLLVLAKGDNQKLISSVSGVNSSLAILDVMLNKGLISPSDFKSSVSKAVKREVYNIDLKSRKNKYKKENNLEKDSQIPKDQLSIMKLKAKKVSESRKGFIKLGSNAKELKNDIKEYFSDPSTSTFETRGNVVKDILGILSQSKSVKENSKEIIELIGGDVTKNLAKGNTKLSQSLGDLVAGVAAEQLTKGLSVGDVYGIIEVNSEVEVIEDSHPSYPFHIRLKDGSSPKLILPKNRQNGSEVLKTSTGKVYRVGNVSVLSGSFNPNIKPKKQVSGRPSIDEVRKFAKENNISDTDVRAYLKETGYSESEIKLAMKKAPSAKKILGKKPIKKTVDTYSALKNQIRLEARAARDAQKDLNAKRKDLAEMIKDLAKKGKITVNQSTVLINRLSSVNLNNDTAVDKLVEYMDKVYKNAEYADNILRSNKSRKKAKNNIRSKIGSAKVVFNTLNKLFSIDAKIIPQSVLDTYNDIVNQFGESRAVLNLEDISVVNEKANSILEAIDNEVSEIPKLQLLFEGLNKVIVKGKEDFAATIGQALSKEEITQEDFDLMKKYKKDIVTPVEKVEVEAEPIVFEFKNNNVEDKMENEGAERLIDLLKNKKAVDQLSDSLKKNIQSVIDNIDAGFFPSYANNIANEIDSIISKDNVVPRIKKGKYVFDRVAAGLKNLLSSNKSTTEYQIRQNPLSDIDNVLGNMNRTDIYDNIFGKAAKSYATLDAQIDIVHEKILEADALLFKQFKNNGNKVTESKYRIMSYMLEREFQSNKDSNKVFSASEAIKAAIESQRTEETTIYSKRDVEILKSILKDFEGDVNINSVFDKFSKREKKAISIIDEVNKSISDKALYTASVIRGSRPNMIDNYVHHSVASSNENSVESITSKYNQFKTFSTKAGTLVERTPGVKALDFDVLKSTIKGAKETLTDYHITDTARVIFKTLNKIQKDIISDKNSTDRQIETANALKKAFDTAMRQVFEMNYVNNGMNLLGKAKALGYKALLASVPRAAAEMGSNLAYVLSTSPKSFATGIKYKEYVLDQRGRDIMINLNSEQTGKLYSKKVTGKTADIGLFVDSKGATPTGAVNGLQNKANQVSSYLSKITTKPTEKIAEALISTPDKAISRPLWFGSLDTKFKEITGSNIDMEAIRNKDSKYLTDNKDALDQATRFADKEVTRAATSINVFNGVLKNKIDPNDSTTLKIVKEINGFMTNFVIYEYTTARSAISALINSGEISRKKGAALLLGTTTRMSLYMVLYQAFSHIFDSAVAALTDADVGDEELPEEDLLVRQLVGSITSMILGRNLGNFAKIVPNISLETINEKYLEDLRKGEDYDPYKHSISFSMLSKEDLKKIQTGRAGIGDILLKSLSGPYSPVVKTLIRAVDLGAKATSEKSKDSTKQKAIEELTTRIVIEMMGNVGMIPFYKDVRRILIKDLFSEDKNKRSPSINLRRTNIYIRK